MKRGHLTADEWLEIQSDGNPELKEALKETLGYRGAVIREAFDDLILELAVIFHMN